MLVRDLGEFPLIETLAQTIRAESGLQRAALDAAGTPLLISIGDDAAAWNAPAGVGVLTTDTMVEGVHFDLAHTDWDELGWKSMAVNLSDLAAMGCTPTYSVVTLGLRGDLPVDGLVKSYRGMLEACRSSGGVIAGGDTVRSPVFFITVAMVGRSHAHKEGTTSRQSLLTRDSAAPGDSIAVTGSLGCSAGGLSMFRGRTVLDQNAADHLRAAHNRPIPRVAAGTRLAGEGVAAAIDISDGLVADLEKLCTASGVGANVNAENVPVDDVLKGAFPENWLDLALTGGEDYELLFSAPHELVGRVAPLLDVPVAVIGEIVDGPAGVTVLDGQGKVIDVERGGWDHFG